MADLLNEFWKEAEKGGLATKHLTYWTGAIRRARPYTLDDDATDLITELASGGTIQDKLGIYRRLGRLPFETVWIELSYEARFAARKRLGTVPPGMRIDDAPERMGWIMERVSDTVWRATTVVDFRLTNSGRNIDTFGATHVISTEGKLDFRSFVRDPVIRQEVMEMNKNGNYATAMWGFGTVVDGVKQYSIPDHLIGSNAVDLPPSWEGIINRDNPSDRVKRERTRDYIKSACEELQGDLRFLLAALATINEVPITFRDFREPGSVRVGGRIREYMVNRIVSIAIPKKRGRITKVLKVLKSAEVRMRRHEVAGHWKRVRLSDGTVERRWISEYMRGDASLGYVRQEREVSAA